MKYHRKITIVTMTLLIVVFLFSNKNYIFNEQNGFGGLIFASTTLKIWNEKSPADYYFCSVLTYTNSGDKFVAYYKRLEDKEGNNYFVSQPPFSNILAYFFFKTFYLSFDFRSLRILNVLLLIAGSVLVYFVVNLITLKKIFEFSISAFVGMTIFLFSPINNYLAASNYAPEFFFWLAGIFFFLYIVQKRSGNFLHFLLLGISVFIVTYTDWIGLFFSCALLLYCVFHIKDKLFLKISVFVLLFALSSLLLTFIQFSSLNGIDEMVHAMKLRLLGRSGLFGEKYSELGIHIFSISSWIMFFKKIHNSFLLFGYLMLLFTIFFLFAKRKIKYTKGVFLFTFFSVILPVIIHFIILFNSNAIHQYYLAKVSVPVSIITGSLFNLLNQNHLFGYKKVTMLFLVIITVILSHFVLKEKYPMISDSSIPVQQGKLIQKNAMPDEAVFISRDTNSDFFTDYYLTFLSDRNLRYADGKDDAQSIAKQLGKTKGVYFELDADTSLIRVNHFIN